MNQNLAIFNSSEDTMYSRPDIPSNVLPQEFIIVSSQSWVIIVIASIIFLGGSVGNLYAVVSLKRALCRRYSSMHHLLLHMCYTELLVIFVTIPLDIAWRLSIGWYAGNFACKITNFTRCFIYFLSSLVLICMSIDCFLNVFYPRKLAQYSGRNRVRWLLATAWLVALISAAPKFYLSYVRAHPIFATFRQCLIESAPAFFTVYPLIESYFSPLIIVVITYTPTFFRLCRQFERVASANKDGHQSSVCDRDNYSNGEIRMDKFTIEGIKISFAFALVVIVCYTPQIILIFLYYVCPNFQSSSREDMIVYFLESFKSVAIPLVYRCFRSSDNPMIYTSRSIEF